MWHYWQHDSRILTSNGPITAFNKTITEVEKGPQNPKCETDVHPINCSLESFCNVTNNAATGGIVVQSKTRHWGSTGCEIILI